MPSSLDPTWRCGRTQIVQAAAWVADGTVTLSGQRKGSLRIGDAGESVEAVTISTLINRFGIPNFMKVDVEGAERDLLTRNTGWVGQVPALNVEVHPDKARAPYTVEECIADLSALGYSARRSDHDWPIVYATAC